MKSQLIITLIIAMLASLAFSQVDTMRLLEIGSVTAPGTITNWYFEDLNGDSIKEIILTTANSVNIYSGQTFAPIWSQSGFTNPKDLNFADINNDSLIDFSVKDTSHIYLIDPHHSTTIWTSPMLDSTYRCYTIGDRNGDYYGDVIIVYKEIFSRSGDSTNLDTAWIKCYDGPSYAQTHNTILLCLNYAYYQYVYLYERYDSPVKITLKAISLNSQNIYRIILFNNIASGYYGHTGGGSASGSIYVFNATNIELHSFYESGYLLSYMVSGVEDSMSLEILSENYSHGSGGGHYSYSNTYSAIELFADTWSVRALWSRSYFGDFTLMAIWNGYALFKDSIGTSQICYSYGDSIYLKVFSNNLLKWCINVVGDSARVINLYKPYPDQADDYILYNLSRFPDIYKLISTVDGSLRYYFPNTNIANLNTVSLHLGQGDHFYSIHSDSLRIFTLAPLIGINDPEFAPSSFFLAPNYPNPFNASTMIEYGLQETGPVKVEIFDILGRKVQTLVDETQAAGYHRVIWNGDDVPSGTYFYHIQAGDNSQTKKCLLLK